jgi:hypothetical protein
MSETIRLVQGDTYNPVQFEIKDKSSADDWDDMTPLDLSKCSKVLLKFKSMATDEVISELICEFYDVSKGLVLIEEWGDTLQCAAGEYRIELETYRTVGGSVQTVQNTVKVKVRAEF